jgi:FkbM family methyltransferase
MLRPVEYVKIFLKSVSELALKFAFKFALDYLGVKTYCTIEYPVVSIKIRVRTSSFWKDLEKGKWELNSIRYISGIVGEGETILDVGAWIEPYTLLFSKLVQDTGSVYAFDPDPKAFGILSDNMEKNFLNDVHIERVCVSNSVGKAQLKNFNRLGDSMGSIIARKEGIDSNETSASTEITVETTTLDKYCEENAFTQMG